VVLCYVWNGLRVLVRSSSASAWTVWAVGNGARLTQHHGPDIKWRSHTNASFSSQNSAVISRAGSLLGQRLAGHRGHRPVLDSGSRANCPQTDNRVRPVRVGLRWVRDPQIWQAFSRACPNDVVCGVCRGKSPAAAAEPRIIAVVRRKHGLGNCCLRWVHCQHRVLQSTDGCQGRPVGEFWKRNTAESRADADCADGAMWIRRLRSLRRGRRQNGARGRYPRGGGPSSCLFHRDGEHLGDSGEARWAGCPQWGLADPQNGTGVVIVPGYHAMSNSF